MVDEAIFSLIDARPGLLKTHFELEDAYAQPQYEIHPPQADLSRLLFEDTAADDEQQAAYSALAHVATGTPPAGDTRHRARRSAHQARRPRG